MFKDFRRWLNKDKTGIEVYDHENARYYFRPLTLEEQSVILQEQSRLQEEETELME